MTHEGLLFGENRDRALSILEGLFLLQRQWAPYPPPDSQNVLNEALDELTGIVVDSIEERNFARYGGKEEGD